MKRAALVLVAACACHRGPDDAKAELPSSCVIEHDGGVTQCFEDVGATARTYGSKYCDEMHGEHTFYAAKACPKDGLLGSCIKRGGTDLERIERCYRDVGACRSRCEKSGGVFHE